MTFEKRNIVYPLPLRDKFLQLILKNKKSKLSQLKVALLNEIKRSGDEPRGEGVYIGEWNQTGHLRSGCSTNTNSYSAFISTVTGGNANYTVVKYLYQITSSYRSITYMVPIINI